MKFRISRAGLESDRVSPLCLVDSLLEIAAGWNMDVAPLLKRCGKDKAKEG